MTLAVRMASPSTSEAAEIWAAVLPADPADRAAEHPAAVALRADSKEAAMTEEQNIIDLRQIVKRFYVGQPNELEILHGIDLQVKKGEFVSIVGASGSGKTTLMNIIGVLDRPTSGAYTLDGVDVAGAKDKELSGIRNRKIGFVFQTYNLISRTTALRNVELPMMYAGVGKKERQEQRVSIARAMTNDPSIILADEPTGALDSVTGRKIMDIFHKLHEEQGKTIVLITHSNELASETERIITLKDGCIIRERKGSGAPC